MKREHKERKYEVTEKNDCGRSEIFYKAYSLAYFKCFKISFTQKQPACLSSYLPQQHCTVHSYASVWGAGLHSALICRAVEFLGVGGPFLVHWAWPEGQDPSSWR